MANDLLNELTRNLKSAEEVGDKEWAKRLKARIAKLEKNPPKPVVEVAVEVTVPVVKPEAPKPAVAKKTTARKRATKTSAVAKKSAATRAAKKSKET